LARLYEPRVWWFIEPTLAAKVEMKASITILKKMDRPKARLKKSLKLFSGIKFSRP
jgi:hypothetical protein